jgi:hypothetical protein
LGSDQLASELNISEILDRESKIDSDYRKNCFVCKDVVQGSENPSRNSNGEGEDSPCTPVNQGINSQLGVMLLIRVSGP